MPRFIAQAEIIGKDRAPKKGSGLRKRTSVILMIDDQTGETRFTSGQNLGVAASELPKLNQGSVPEATEYNPTTGPSLSNVLKSGVSVPHIDTEEETKKRGGDKRFKIPKPASSFNLGKAPDKFVGNKKS